MLVEKALTTPEQYPLTLNAAVNGANQKSNRDPVLALSDDEVSEALDGLIDKELARKVFPGNSRVDKYCHTGTSTLKIEIAQLAVLAELLMRGPQTPAELRTRAGRMLPIESRRAADGAARAARSRAAWSSASRPAAATASSASRSASAPACTRSTRRAAAAAPTRRPRSRRTPRRAPRWRNGVDALEGDASPAWSGSCAAWPRSSASRWTDVTGCRGCRRAARGASGCAVRRAQRCGRIRRRSTSPALRYLVALIVTAPVTTEPTALRATDRTWPSSTSAWRSASGRCSSTCRSAFRPAGSR